MAARTEAFTWLGTAMGAGFAAGGVLGGAVVQGSGAPAGFAAAVARSGRAALRAA